ncbi:VOC family protein [Polymorphobacter fuscus]|uniref:VOC family protein n=1 Tax=Sandarakinorhabdus fusca TaxID=1439888 RepID=A0A7C9KYX8_9SPHN|nr:VOC family protein [Polymorphobacter fuscus]KAB7646185.1 VOC family protein [Polymorphobacter fuscus]MQT17388.1 VOC family protein [Polymorphobacter fuscus]NJC10078.1 putative glyoxalase superfamily protein PhnB [Polymorphobacter fuscus]
MTETMDARLTGVTPHIVCNDAAAAIAFYKAAFGATEMMRLPGPDGRLYHASVMINGGLLMLVDEFPEMPVAAPTTLNGSSVTLHLYSDDATAAIARAAAAGATVTMEAQPMFWGDMYGMVTDPFGHVWAIATPMGPPKTADELAAAMAGA